METELVLLVQGPGDGVALGEDGRGDLAPVALDDEVVGRSAGAVLSDSEGESQHLVVRETLVPEELSCGRNLKIHDMSIKVKIFGLRSCIHRSGHTTFLPKPKLSCRGNGDI